MKSRRVFGLALPAVPIVLSNDVTNDVFLYYVTILTFLIYAENNVDNQAVGSALLYFVSHYDITLIAGHQNGRADFGESNKLRYPIDRSC
jgi:hypothetical protein